MSVDLERSETAAEFQAKVATTTTAQIPKLYDEAGFTYDAIATLLDARMLARDTEDLNEHLVALLEKIGIGFGKSE